MPARLPAQAVGDAGSYYLYPVNTRGIPYDVDPRRFYEYRAQKQQVLADNWLEMLVYDIFGPDFIGSLALAIDPFARFKMSKMQVSPVNRLRQLQAIYPRVRRGFEHTRFYSWSVSPTCLVPNPSPNVTNTSTQDPVSYLSQGAIASISLDTTYRSRPHGVDFGEFEYFKPSIGGDSGFSFSWRRLDTMIGFTVHCGSTDLYQIGYQRSDRESWMSSNGRYSTSSFNTLLAAERTFSDQLMAREAMGMLLRALPTSRSFSLFREIAELKDLPRTLRSTYDTLLRITSASKYFKKSFSQLRLSDVPKMAETIRREAKRLGDNHLNSQFGWLPMLRALRDVITLPTRISQKANRLIERNGKLSSWTSQRKLVYPLTSPPGWSLDAPPGVASLGSVSTVGTRQVTLRCVVNASVKFPEVRVPFLKEDLLDELWGANPRLTDLYNLIPWTWLIDWFSDLGDYVQVMDVINDDRTLINGGFLTYSSSCEITSSRVANFTSAWSREWVGVYNTGLVSTTLPVRQCALASFSYRKRRDLAAIADVRSTADLGSLNLDQAAILGALLTKFA